VQRVVVFGASGYSGLELVRRLAGHPRLRVAHASSNREAGRAVSELVVEADGSLSFEPHDAVLDAVVDGDIVCLATPADTSADLAPKLLDRGARVVDLSGAFRIPDPEVFAEWYGFEHPCPERIAEAAYGLPELLPVPPSARLVANPGCYATASILAIAPLLSAGLVRDGAPIVVDGKSGTTGAGKKGSEALIFSEVGENLRPYRLTRHQHTPEIERALEMVSGRPVTVGFTAHLVPMRRGILVSAYAPAAGDVTDARLEEAYREAYRGSSNVRFSTTPPETGRVQWTNHTEVHARIDPRIDTILAFAAIDNLVKGAAGQAIQNVEALLGAERA
jgi:N-acetyl-gamma-glutamyl-phosphate reductase